MTKTNNSIINVTVNGLSATDAIASVKTRLETVEKSAFNIALLCAYTLGDTIPSYIDSKGNEHAEAVCDKPIKKQADLLKLIGRSKATLSRWIKAMRLIIEHGHFTEFASGSLPFSYDKIITIIENNDKFSGYVFADLMTMSCDTLEAMTVVSTEETTTEDATEEEAETTEEATEEETTTEDATEEEAETTEEATEEETTTEDATEETAVLTYNGKEYIVNKDVFEKWLAENATLA